MKRLALAFWQYFTHPVERATAPPVPYSALDINDLVGHVYYLIGKLKSCKTNTALDDVADEAELISHVFDHLPEMPHHVADLHQQILLRRCELLATQYHDEIL